MQRQHFLSGELEAIEAHKYNVDLEQSLQVTVAILLLFSAWNSVRCFYSMHGTVTSAVGGGEFWFMLSKLYVIVAIYFLRFFVW